MGLFGRRGAKDSPVEDAVDVDEGASAGLGDDSEGPDSEAPGSENPSALSHRPDGPWDIDEDYPNEPRVDLGAIRLPQREDVRIQVQADPSSGNVAQLSLVTGQSAVQIQPYAAPRTAGMWEDIRGEIRSSINKSGGLVEETQGEFGVELHAQVKAQDGSTQPARFCGIDGPRWFVRLVFLGQAARDRQAAQALEAAVRGMVIVRGNEAMPMGNAIPMRVPQNQSDDQGVTPDAGKAPERTTITLPERGPEITETR